MPDTKTSAIAIVTMTVSIELSQPWGADCTLVQVQKQARDGAHQAMHSLAKELGARGVRVDEIRSMWIVLNEEKLGPGAQD